MPVHNQIRGDDPMRLVGEKLIKENVAAMHATLDVNTEEKLLESVAMLRDARRIVLTGIGASGLVARNFGWKLTKIGYNAIVEQDMHALLATVQAMDPDDLLLAISYSGERREINMATDEALRVGGKFWRLLASARMCSSSGPPAVCIPLPRNRPLAVRRFRRRVRR